METFAFVAQLISTFSVIVSLVYLAFQIRENTRSVRRAAERDITRDLNDLGRYFIEMPDLAELYLKALAQPQELTAAERLRFERLLTHTVSSLQMAFEYHAAGQLGDETMQAYSQGVLQLLDNPAVMEWWEREGHVFSQRFRKLVSRWRAAQPHSVT